MYYINLDWQNVYFFDPANDVIIIFFFFLKQLKAFYINF